jgi:hypothetical protein
VPGKKLVCGRKSDGETYVFGDIDPIEYTLARGLFGGGDRGVYGKQNVIEYITTGQPGNATDFGDLTIARTFLAATSNGSNDRGVWAAGFAGMIEQNIIDYVAIGTTGDAADFGDTTRTRHYVTGTSNGTNNRGVFVGDNDNSNDIEYITITSLGNGTDFGDLTSSRREMTGNSCSNYTNNRGLFPGGYATVWTANINYINISSLGNASSFGNMTAARGGVGGTSNGTGDRGVHAGGWGASYYDTIDYVTISTTGDATDFGNLVSATRHLAATSNMTNNQGVFGGGYLEAGSLVNIIEYITISSTGNSQDFGDLSASKDALAACSNA